ncbi:MAG: hypothetical protein WCN98_19925, partial [Verrucomicrobiaceae bacterium]
MGAVSIHFLEPQVPPRDRDFEKHVRQVSRVTAKAARKTPVIELHGLFASALQDLETIANAYEQLY